MMQNRRVDYDQIAPTYDQRFLDDQPRGTATTLLSLVREFEAEQILEVGCGTGHWLSSLRPVTDQLYGLDFSAGMLRPAWQRDRKLVLVRGRAGQLAFPDASFDLVYCINAIHHFDQQRAFIFEARRLLRPGGALAVIGFDPRQHRDKWYIFDYFDGAFETDLARFPSWGMVLDWMAEANFARVEWQLAERVEDHKQGRAVLDDPYLQKSAASQLALLSDDEYAAGLRRIESALAAGETAFPCEIFIRMLVGRV